MIFTKSLRSPALASRYITLPAAHQEGGRPGLQKTTYMDSAVDVGNDGWVRLCLCAFPREEQAKADDPAWNPVGIVSHAMELTGQPGP